MADVDYGPRTADELRARQLERLRWTVGHAYRNSAHYRDVFDRAGLTPDDIRSLDDLARVPFTTKADLRAHYPFGMFAVPMDRVARSWRGRSTRRAAGRA